MGNLGAFFQSLGISGEAFFDLAAYFPLFVLLLAVGLFGWTMHTNAVQERKNKMVQRIVASSKVRRGGLSQEEILARLTPRSMDKTRPLHLTILETILKLAKFDRQETEKKLIQSGDRDPRAISRYILQRGLGMMVGPILIWFIGPSLGLQGPVLLLMAATGVLAGGIVVDSRLDKALARRKLRVTSEMPVLLDLLTIYLQAGQAFDGSMARASMALEKSFPVVAEEAAFLVKDLDLSVDREKTLREFGDRLGITSARTFVNIVIQAERRGNAIAPSLQVLAKEARKEVIMDVERRAQKLPTLMQLPMFLFILPAIFASVIGPAVIQIMQTLSGGIVGQ